MRQEPSEPFASSQALATDRVGAAAGSGAQTSVPHPSAGPVVVDRIIALAEVLLCSGFPTQLTLAAALMLAGLRPFDTTGRLSIGYVGALSLADAALVLLLIFAFLAIHRESPRVLFLGRRPIGRESLIGLLLVPVVLAVALSVLGLIQLGVPSLHNVAQNPLEALIRTPRDAWFFGVVVVLAGGVREEIQRAFVLHRFERFLGGGAVGVIVFSLAFGAGHVIQGYDAAITTALLGALWGVLYLGRRSVMAPMISHTGFNLAEIANYVALS